MINATHQRPIIHREQRTRRYEPPEHVYVMKIEEKKLKSYETIKRSVDSRMHNIHQMFETAERWNGKLNC